MSLGAVGNLAEQSLRIPRVKLYELFGGSSKEKSSESSVEFLVLPADGNYLIVQKVVEECPMCYSKLKIGNATYNVSFLFYKFFCGCGLKIFITPANFSHSVTILDTESSQLLMKKTTTKHNLNKKKGNER